MPCIWDASANLGCQLNLRWQSQSGVLGPIWDARANLNLACFTRGAIKLRVRLDVHVRLLLDNNRSALVHTYIHTYIQIHLHLQM